MRFILKNEMIIRNSRGLGSAPDLTSWSVLLTWPDQLVSLTDLTWPDHKISWSVELVRSVGKLVSFWSVGQFLVTWSVFLSKYSRFFVMMKTNLSLKRVESSVRHNSKFYTICFFRKNRTSVNEFLKPIKLNIIFI